jgi:hypothetical protein
MKHTHHPLFEMATWEDGPEVTGTGSPEPLIDENARAEIDPILSRGGTLRTVHPKPLRELDQ